MKKLTISFIAILLLTTIQVGYAKPINNLENSFNQINKYLQEENGIEEINQNFNNASTKAKANLAKDATLYEFKFLFTHQKTVSTTFNFSSQINKESTFSVENSTTSNKGNLINKRAKTKNNLYNIKLRMRDLIPALIQEQQTLSTLDKILTTKTPKIEFILRKTRFNIPYWKIHITDTKQKQTYIIITRADQETPSFITLRKNK